MDYDSSEGSGMDDLFVEEEIESPLPPEDGEDAVIHALGIPMMPPHTPGLKVCDEEVSYRVVPNPDADVVDLSDLRGTRAPTTGAERHAALKSQETDDDLDALAELVPELKSRTRESPGENHGMMTMDEVVVSKEAAKVKATIIEEDNNSFTAEEVAIEVAAEEVEVEEEEAVEQKYFGASMAVIPSTSTRADLKSSPTFQKSDSMVADSMQVQESTDEDEQVAIILAHHSKKPVKPSAAAKAKVLPKISDAESDSSSHHDKKKPIGKLENDDQNLGGFDDVGSEHALYSDDDMGEKNARGTKGDVARKPRVADYGHAPSSNSLSTATQTHEVRMPMYLPTFKPATGCTNASDFIVRCFVARLRSGITVVKHGRSRWCKSRLRILHIHPDGRSLSWKPAVGEPTSSKRPPKLDLSTCMEVRHAWSPDPLNPMFTGTPILRQKCEAANAHKSFALIFPKRTVDITAVTADQCKVLMEGFSALCFRLQVANLAGRGSKKGKDGVPRSAADEEEVATTASVTLTNNSTQLSPSGSGGGGRQKRISQR